MVSNSFLHAILIASVLPLSQATLASSDVPLPYSAWVQNLSLYDNMRISFETQATPTQFFLDNLTKTSDDTALIMRQIGAKVTNTVRVSRQNEMERFEVIRNAYALDLKSAQHAETPTPEKYIQIHGEGKFFRYDESYKRGAIREQWPDRVVTPLNIVAPPDLNHAEIVAWDSKAYVIDIKTKENDLLRYHLDPENSMMPKKIEYHDILNDGSLFLFRFLTVEEYEKTENGAYLPIRATVHDYATQEEDGSVTVGVKKAFEVIQYEENVVFSPEEFLLDFPNGTYVTDYTLDVTFVAGLANQFDQTIQNLDLTAASDPSQYDQNLIENQDVKISGDKTVGRTTEISQKPASQTVNSRFVWIIVAMVLVLGLLAVWAKRKNTTRAD